MNNAQTWGETKKKVNRICKIKIREARGQEEGKNNNRSWGPPPQLKDWLKRNQKITTEAE